MSRQICVSPVFPACARFHAYALYNCSSLAAVTFGNRLVSIGKYCFRACALTQVTVPASVTTLGFNPFICCEKLASISVNSGNSFFCGVDGVLFNKEKTTLIGYPGGKPGGYTVPAGVTKIGGWAFHSNPRLTSVTIPESVRTIEDYAFQWCDNLVGVKFQGDAPAVGADVFNGNNKATVGYLPGKKGWGKEFAGRPVHPVSGDFAYAEENNTMTIARYLGAGGAVTIPDRVNGIPVATIGGSAFSGCIDVTSVTIPRGVMAIRDWAFYGCTRLAKATIPDSLTSIGLGAFHSCPNLVGIKIPASVTSLDRASFSYDTALKSITVAPANPSYCSADGVLFSKDKTRLINYPCGRAGSYVVPKGVTTIGPNAFEGADKLTGVTIPDTVRAIENNAFLACSGLTGITIPHSVTNIADGAFQSSTNLAKVTLENGVVNIGNAAFAGCLRLANITIPNSVARIGERVFKAAAFAEIRIPSSVTTIGINPFDCCGNLRSITVEPANPAYSSKDGVLFNKDMTSLIGFSISAPGSYEIPGTVTNICDSAFAGCYKLAGIALPEKVTRLGHCAFYACTNLTGLYCKGNAPADGGGVFAGGTDKATVYYLPETTGWGRDLAGRPTAVWNPPAK